MSSSFGKAFMELHELNLIPRMPRLAVINAAGANTFYQLYEKHRIRWNGGRPDREGIDSYMAAMDAGNLRANTLASAIEINRPVNLPKALRSLERCGGVVREVSDQEMLDAKAKVAAGGLGCEPASAASVAGAGNCGKKGSLARMSGLSASSRDISSRTRRRRSPITRATRRCSKKSLASAASAVPRSPTNPCKCRTTLMRSSRRSKCMHEL